MGQVFEKSEMELLVETFLNEAEEFLEEMEAGLLSLEECPEDTSVVDQVFRAAHSLKGSSMAVGLNQVGGFTHEVEALLLKVKEHQIDVSSEVISLLLQCNDHVRTMIDELKVNNKATFESEGLIAELKKAQGIKGQTQQTATPSAGFALFDEEDEADTKSPETKVEAAAPSPTEEQDNSNTEHSKSNANNATRKRPPEQIKVSQDRVDRLVNNIGEMAILLTVLEEQMHHFAGTNIEKTVKQLFKISKDVQDVSVSLRMLPVKPIFQKMKRIVRDTSSKLNKKVNLEVIGEDLEVDKSILDMVGDPLVHIIRNACDHGVELPEERVKVGKKPEGKVTLEACHESGRLVFYITDDGKGIDAQRIKEKALRLGIIQANQKMSTQELQNLIFHPGFSTKEAVTDISGRGVGMDVVWNNIKKMSGEIEIKSEFGSGSRFKISLPQTFSIIEGTVVVSGGERFVLPLADIIESVKVKDVKISPSSALGEILYLRGQRLPVYRFNEIFLTPCEKKDDELVALIAQFQDKSFAVIVDEILSRQQIVIKSLGTEMQGIKEFSGSTILGDGKPALIVELSNLIRRKKKPSLDIERISA